MCVSLPKPSRALCLILTFAASLALAQTPAAPAIARDKVDQIAQQVLASTGVPSASIAIVKDGQIAYVQAYGDARLEPRAPAKPDMRYAIGSISKQFTAAAVMLLVEQGKLSLDDKVSRFLPNLTRANEVTIRQLLSHTSGYQDYWPQDYVPPFMLQPVSAEKIMDLWARKPLDYDPGTKWQYSNTGYVIAGVIVEKAAGMPLMQFLQTRIFAPLDMASIANVDQAKLPDSDPAGYLRYALGPPRPAPKEGKGWIFAAGELAMTPTDLAKWDVSLINQRILKPASYKEMETQTMLKNGLAVPYGLGLTITQQAGHRILEHGGEVSGFTAENIIYPDDRAAIVVLTNQDAASASGQIARRIAALLFAGENVANAEKDAEARKIFAGLQNGTIDRALFTDNATSYFTLQALNDFANSLGPLGTPEEFVQTGQQDRGGMSFRAYRIRFAKKTLSLTIRAMPDGKIEQYQISAAN
jgi:CubicO group peptidase (beta-lactamase class C family)